MTKTEIKKPSQYYLRRLLLVVGAARFELATFPIQSGRNDLNKKRGYLF